MGVRGRLILAFLAVSVLPLTAVTLYSYRTTLAAFRAAIHQESLAATREMRQRMELVRTDIDRQLQLLGDEALPQIARRGIRSDAEAEQLATQFAARLGRTADLLETLEVVPGTMPGTPTPQPPSAPPRIVIDIGRALRDQAREVEQAEALRVAEAGVAAATGTLPESERMSLEQRLAELRLHLRRLGSTPPDAPQPPAPNPPGAAATVAPRSMPPAVETPPALETAPPAEAQRAATAPAASPAADESSAPPARRHWARPTMDVVPEPTFDFEIRSGDAQTGSVRARLDLDRTLRLLLSMVRRDQGEVPFALDAQGVLHALAPADFALFHRIGLPDHLRGDRARGGGVALAATGAAAADAAASGSAAPSPGSEGVWLSGWLVVTVPEPQSGIAFGIARPLSDALSRIQRTMVQNLAIGLGVVLVALAGIVPLSGTLTRRLRELIDGVQQIAKGDLAARVPSGSNDEVGRLARAVNSMAADLAAQQRLLVKQERLRKELELCRQIQTEMLPKAPLRLGVAEIEGISVPAREVGGDFFNYFPLGPDEVALLVGDVSGKGVGAALLMANVQATLRARLPLDRDLARLADQLDHEIEAQTPTEVYLTLFLAVLDTRAGTLRYVSAGHNALYLLRADGRLEALDSTGLPLGLFAGQGFEERSVPLASGDQLFLYTDGAVEAEDPHGEMFGRARLEALLAAAVARRDAAPRDLLREVDAAVRAFRAGSEPADDATMVLLRIGAPDASA